MTHSAPLTRDAQRSVMDAMGEVAWPTVILGVGLGLAYVATLVAAGLGVLPVWGAFALVAAIVYLVYTVVHESVHGAISGTHRSLHWLNEALGLIDSDRSLAHLAAYLETETDVFLRARALEAMRSIR